MKTRMRVRYYCDFCGKSMGYKNHMANHEKHCTMNPNRVCRMCETLQKCDGETEQLPMAVLLAALEIPNEDSDDYRTFLEWDSDDHLESIKSVTKCPACILAAIRQAGYSSGVYNFEYEKEAQAIFKELREYENEGISW